MLLDQCAGWVILPLGGVPHCSILKCEDVPGSPPESPKNTIDVPESPA